MLFQGGFRNSFSIATMSLTTSSTRRRFLYRLAGAGAFGLGGLGFLSRPDERRDSPEDQAGNRDPVQLQPARRTARAFGTTVSVAAWHAEEQTAKVAVDAAFRELAL